jgi:tRNA 2-thiouridine synthesizing protein D
MSEINVTNKSKVLTIVITKGPYVSESADIALKTALKAKKKGYQVNVFLFLDGTWISHLTSDKNFNNCGDWLKRVIRKGITVKMCERCSNARDLTQDNIIEGINIPGTYQFIDMIKKSDKVLSFGG